MSSNSTRLFDAAALDTNALVADKGSSTISVCIPARDEAATIGPLIESIILELVERHALVDEVIVVDDGSTDSTAVVARQAGATVYASGDILPSSGPGRGKGDALWKSLAVSKGDIVAWCDADVRQFDPRFITGLVGPLLLHPELQFVKGFYERPLDGRPGEGGRVTELVARPVLSLLFPALATFIQPLAGEFAGRRPLLERMPFASGYGVDLALLVDIATDVGLGAIAQVDLGTRVHRNRPLAELSIQALEVLGIALQRAGVDTTDQPVLQRPGHPPVVVAPADARPPLVEVPAYRREVS